MIKKHYLLTPGPTPVPPEVLTELALPILHHRTSEFGEIFSRVSEGLKYIFKTKDDVYVYASSGTGAMEAAVVNLLSPGDKALVVSTGAFGSRWAKIIQSFGIKPDVISVEWGQPADPGEVEVYLKKNPDTRAVFVTHTETSTGVVNDLEKIGTIVGKTDAVLVADAISGLGGEPLMKDEWGLDVVVSSSQKGLMLPPGLSFISMSEKGWRLAEKSALPKFYWDIKRMKKSAADKETPFTPAVGLFVGLARAIDIIKSAGLENLWAEYLVMAEATRAGMTALGLELFAKNPCRVVTSVRVPDGVDGGKIVKMMRLDYGVSIAGGQEHLKGKIFRFAHMGYISRADILVGFSALEMTLERLGYKNFKSGAGVAAVEERLK